MAVRLRVEPYDPDARDADGDGIVQEQTAWERPVGTRLISDVGEEIARGLTSESRPSFRIVDREGRVVPYTPRYGASGDLGTAPKGSMGLQSPKFQTLSDLGYLSIGDIVYPAPRAPKASTPEANKSRAPKPGRTSGLLQIAFNVDEHDEVLSRRIDSMLEKHLPEEKRNLPPREYMDDLMASIGIVSPKSFEEQLNDGLIFIDGPMRKQLDKMRASVAQDPNTQKNKRVASLLEQVDTNLKLLETEEGREILKNKMAEKHLSILQGYEDVFQQYPALRGNSFSSLYETDDKKPGSGGYAGSKVDDSGLLQTYIRFNPNSLVLDGLSIEDLEAGQVFDSSVRINKADDYNSGLAIHELGHQAHFVSVYKRHGIEPSRENTIADQLRANGDTFDTHHLALEFALREGFNPTVRFDELTDEERLALSKSVTGLPYRFPDSSVGKPEGWYDSLELKAGASGILSGDAKNLAPLVRALDSAEGLPSFYEGSEGLDSPQAIEEAVRGVTGMSLSELVSELFAAKSEDYGMDLRTVAFGGMSRPEVEKTLGPASEYGLTSPFEAIAESFQLSVLMSRHSDVQVSDDDKASIVGGISNVLTGLDEPTKAPKVSERSRRAYMALFELLDSDLFLGIRLSDEGGL